MNSGNHGIEYSSDMFVGREDEIELVLKKAETLKQRSALDRRTVIFTGERGIGKSWLLAHLRDRLKELKGIVVFSLNLANYANLDSNLADYTKPDVILALMKKIRSDMLDLPKADGVTTVAEVSDELMNEIDRKREGKPLALLVDTVYESDWYMLAALEEYLFAPLALDQFALIVMTGRGRRYPWKTPELKIFADFRPLRPFEEVRMTEEQLKRQKQEALPRGEEIHNYSGGNPLVNYLLATCDNLAKGLNQAVEEMLDKVPDDDYRHTVRGYLEALCVLRAFDEARIPMMLSAYHDDEDYRSWSYEDARPVCEEVVKWGSASWDRELGGYVLDKAIRKLLKHYLREAKPALWKKLQESARRLYERMKQKCTRGQTRWQEEINYHARQLEIDRDYLPAASL